MFDVDHHNGFDKDDPALSGLLGGGQ